MSHTSPASFLVWAIISCMLGTFLLFHLWSFDRFKCLKWNNGPYSGAFKRVMTYSYMLSVPLIMSYAVGFAVIKYYEGFVNVPGHGVIPRPHDAWGPAAKSAIFPLTLMFSVAWSLEMVTHLEELCFWLFLVNAGSAQQDWFRSLYFKTWVFGSVCAVAYMPLVTIFTRDDPLKNEAYTFLAGSLGSLSLTLWFTPILWTFPSFLNNLRREGVDMSIVVRLTKFHELNIIRIIFRFLFTVPLVILGVDGVRPHTHINESMGWTDFLVILAAFGCVVSSGITLVIFFPRSIEGEIASREASRERRRNRSAGKTTSIQESRNTNFSQTVSMSQNVVPASGTYLLTSSPVRQFDTLSRDQFNYENPTGTSSSPLSPQKAWLDDVEESERLATLPRLPPMRPNRRKGADVEIGGIAGLTETNLSKHNSRMSNVNPMVHNFTSPIDIAYANATQVDKQHPHDARFAFARP